MTKKKLVRLSIDTQHRDKFEYIKDKLPEGTENIDVFILAMAWGYKEDRAQQLKSKYGVVRFDSIDPKSMNMIRALAASKSNDLNVLSSQKDIFKIADEYANGGLIILYDELEGSDLDSIEVELTSALQKAQSILKNKR